MTHVPWLRSASLWVGYAMIRGRLVVRMTRKSISRHKVGSASPRACWRQAQAGVVWPFDVLGLGFGGPGEIRTKSDTENT